MDIITTARILADKALQKVCGQECVDWAMSMLEQGGDGHYLAMLATMSPPFNHFEIASYRDHALKELGISDIDASRAVSTYAAERLRLLLNDEADPVSVLGVIKDLCVANGYQRDIFDFYLLYLAYTDLQEYETQWYWNGATRENIVSIIRQGAEAFIQSSDLREV